MSINLRPIFAGLLFAALAVIASACGGGGDLDGSTTQITVEEIINDVETDRPRESGAGDSDFQAAALGQDLISGDSLKTFRDSEARVDVIIQGRVRVIRSKPGTIWRLGRFSIDQGTIFELEQGKLFIIDEGFGEDLPDLEVVTPIGAAAARGTWLSVQYDADSGTLEAKCFREPCELSNALGTVVLTDEQKSTLTAQTAPTGPVTMDESDLQVFLDLPEARSGEIPIPGLNATANNSESISRSGDVGRDEIRFTLGDGMTLGIWDEEELLNVEPQYEGGPALADIITIVLSCKVYEPNSYEYIDACRDVPDDFLWIAVEVRASNNTQSFSRGDIGEGGFGMVLRVESDDTVTLVDPRTPEEFWLTTVNRISVFLENAKATATAQAAATDTPESTPTVPPVSTTSSSANAIDPSERIANGLVGLWHFDGDADDSSGNGNHGTAVNNVTYSGGVFGQALQLDGESAFVQIPDAPSLNPTDAITIQAWYSGPAFRGAGNNALIDKGAASHVAPYYQYHLGITGKDYRSTLTGNEPGIHFSTGGTLRSLTTNSAQLQLGIWHHLVFTYNGARAAFYVDGVPVLGGNITGPLPGFGDPSFNTDLFIGTWANLQSSSDNFLPGFVDEVAIWSRSLSESEVFELFSRGVGN